MQSKKLVFGVVGVLVVAAGWYLFRPERLVLDAKVNESLQTGTAVAGQDVTQPVELVRGQFHDGSHETRGTAAIFELADGKRVLRFTGFHTSNGPDVQVYLIAAGDALDNDTVKRVGFVEVGALKGNVGDQNYELPAGLDLDKYRAVTIWCRRFGVNFGTAPLAPPTT